MTLLSFSPDKPEGFRRIGPNWCGDLVVSKLHGRYYFSTWRDGFIGSVSTLEELDLLIEAENTPPPTRPGGLRPGAREVCYPGSTAEAQRIKDELHEGAVRALREQRAAEPEKPGKRKFDPSLVNWNSEL